MTQTKMTPLACLMKFFGKKEGQTLKGFLDEVGKLSQGERDELSKLAAIKLGVTTLEDPK